MARYLQQSVVKSIQHVLAMLATDDIATLITISSVNTAKTIVIFNGYTSPGTSGIEGMVKIELASSTIVMATRYSYDDINTYIAFDVIEYY